MPQSSTSGFSNDNTANVYVDNTYGGYYTWHAATAGSGQNATTDGKDATESIAPKGWKLPNAADYGTLILSYNATTNGLALETAPLNFQRGGYYKNSTSHDVGSYSDYWTATAHSSSQAYFMPHNSSSATVASNGNRIDGMTLRCIATLPQRTAKSITELTYLQDFADLDDDSRESVINSMGPEAHTLKDKRDSHPYKIAKLKDGNIWMVENLRLAGYTCKPDDSDIVNGTFTLPQSGAGAFGDSNNVGVIVDNTYGGYYTWLAATANTGKSLSSTGALATGSISPKGWKLPTQAEYDNLATLYGGDNSTGSSNLRATPVPGFVLAGWLGSNPTPHGLDWGRYWSSTSYADYQAYCLDISSSRATRASYNRGSGIPVRCVFKVNKG